MRMSLALLPKGAPLLLVTGETALQLSSQLDGFDWHVAHEIRAAQELILSRRPRVVLLHWRELGVYRADEACEALNHEVPVLALLDADAPRDAHIIALDAGADASVRLNASSHEFEVQLAVLTRRFRRARRRLLRLGRLVLDLSAHEVSCDGKPVQLTTYEFGLLAVLAQEADQVISREELLERAKGSLEESFERSIDVHICRLRAKLGAPLLKTVRGVGYVLRTG
jgi:DNA-binding response OmpR family regulator